MRLTEPDGNDRNLHVGKRRVFAASPLFCGARLMLSYDDTDRMCGLRLKCDGTRSETTFHLSPKGTSPFKSAGASVQSTTGNQGVSISGSNAGYTMF